MSNVRNDTKRRDDRLKQRDRRPPEAERPIASAPRFKPGDIVWRKMEPLPDSRYMGSAHITAYEIIMAREHYQLVMIVDFDWNKRGYTARVVDNPESTENIEIKETETLLSVEEFTKVALEWYKQVLLFHAGRQLPSAGWIPEVYVDQKVGYRHAGDPKPYIGVWTTDPISLDSKSWLPVRELVYPEMKVLYYGYWGKHERPHLSYIGTHNLTELCEEKHDMRRPFAEWKKTHHGVLNTLTPDSMLYKKFLNDKTLQPCKIALKTDEEIREMLLQTLQVAVDRAIQMLPKLKNSKEYAVRWNATKPPQSNDSVGGSDESTGLHRGPRGGQYYIDRVSGRKRYVRR